MPRNCHRVAREGSARGPDNSSPKVLDPTASLRTPRNLAKGRRDGRRTPRRGRGRELLRGRPRPQPAETGSCRSETCQSSRTAGTGRQGRRIQGWRGIRRLGRELHDAGPGQPRGARRFLPNQSGWPLFFALTFLLFRGERVPKICERRDRHTSHFKEASVPDATSPRHRACCDCHEARAGIVALMSCCLVRLSSGGLGPPDEVALPPPACTQRIACRGAALASRPDPLTLSGDDRGAARLCYLLCSTELPFHIQNLSVVHATQTTGPADDLPKSHPLKTSPPLAPAFPFALQLHHCSVAFQMRGARFLQSEELRRVWSRLLICYDPTTVAFLRSQNTTVQVCLHTATHLSGSQIIFKSFLNCGR